MRIYRWDLLAVSHHSDKSFDLKHCDSGGIMFLNYYVTSLEHMFKGLYELMGESHSH